MVTEIGPTEETRRERERERLVSRVNLHEDSRHGCQIFQLLAWVRGMVQVPNEAVGCDYEAVSIEATASVV
jgi:hypothetical protein